MLRIPILQEEILHHSDASSGQALVIRKVLVGPQDTRSSDQQQFFPFELGLPGEIHHHISIGWAKLEGRSWRRFGTLKQNQEVRICPNRFNMAP